MRRKSKKTKGAKKGFVNQDKVKARKSKKGVQDEL
jgi:hypothetical protein